MTNECEILAGRLSKAQREALLAFGSTRARYAGKGQGAALMALYRKGLVRNCPDSVGNNQWAPTVSGLKLQAYIKQEGE